MQPADRPGTRCGDTESRPAGTSGASETSSAGRTPVDVGRDAVDGGEHGRRRRGRSWSVAKPIRRRPTNADADLLAQLAAQRSERILARLEKSARADPTCRRRAGGRGEPAARARAASTTAAHAGARGCRSRSSRSAGSDGGGGRRRATEASRAPHTRQKRAVTRGRRRASSRRPAAIARERAGGGRLGRDGHVGLAAVGGGGQPGIERHATEERARRSPAPAPRRRRPGTGPPCSRSRRAPAPAPAAPP